MADETAVDPDSPAGVGEGLFLRQATGLVRELSLANTVLLAIAYISFPLGYVFLTQIGTDFPGANVILVFVLTMGIGTLVPLVYGMMAAAMPRSGGDYVFISRNIHPMLGYVANSAITLSYITGASFVALFVPLFALPAMFQALFISTGHHFWLSWSTSVAGKAGQLLIGGGIVVLVGIFAMLRPRLLMRVFGGLMALTLLGLVVTIVALLFVDQTHFDHRFAADYLVTVSKIEATARHGGLVTGFSLLATFGAITLVQNVVGASNVATYWAGEVRRAPRAMVPAVLTGLWVSSLAFIVVALLLGHAFGWNFLNSANFTSLNAASTWPSHASPFLNLYVSVASASPVLAVVLGITFVAAVLAYPVPTYLIATRNIFAHAFDRVLPGWVGSVDNRTHAPVNATLVILAIMLLYLFGYVFGWGGFTSFIAVTILVNCCVYFLTAVSAIIFPYRHPELYRTAPFATRKVFGLPILVAVAIPTVLYTLGLIYILTLSKWAKGLGTLNSVGFKAVIVILILLSLIWLVSWGRSRRRGFDLNLVQRVLPPE